MTSLIVAFIAGVGIGTIFSLLYIDGKYLGVEKSKLNKDAWEMWKAGQGAFSLVFIPNPPKPNLMLSAPRRAKLTVVKGSSK
jgi:hypothetical protein